jgi:hypothetical protein
MIKINIEKAKTIAHQLRRQAREKEFNPYDEIISKRIPGKTEEAEIEREKIRLKYSEIQLQIDNSLTDFDIINTIKLFKDYKD